MQSSSTARRHRLSLQIVIAVFGLIPVCAGLAGCVFGLNIFDGAASFDADLDSHGRYLSGLLLGVGLGFWSCIADIEHQGPRVRLLTAIVFIGGLARLYDLIAVGWPGPEMSAALAMELLVTPAVAIWRENVDKAAMRPQSYQLEAT